MTKSDVVIFTVLFVMIAAVMCLYMVSYVIYGPDPKPAEPTYTTADGSHHGCKLTVFPGIIQNDTWMLECPDGYIQHNGNYEKEY